MKDELLLIERDDFAAQHVAVGQLNRVSPRGADGREKGRRCQQSLANRPIMNGSSWLEIRVIRQTVSGIRRPEDAGEAL